MIYCVEREHYEHQPVLFWDLCSGPCWESGGIAENLCLRFNNRQPPGKRRRDILYRDQSHPTHTHKGALIAARVRVNAAASTTTRCWRNLLLTDSLWLGSTTVQIFSADTFMCCRLPRLSSLCTCQTFLNHKSQLTNCIFFLNSCLFS